MDYRVRFAVAGEPIEHSLSPELFALVSEHLGLKWDMPRKISASSPNHLYSQLAGNFGEPDLQFSQRIIDVTKNLKTPLPEYIPYGDSSVGKSNSTSRFDMESDVFVSITSPLKHKFTKEPVNCLKFNGNNNEYFNSDGLGFVIVAKHFGILPEKEMILGLKGGGSTAIATALAWQNAGGKIKLYSGNRKLNSNVISSETHEKENLFVDYDDSSCAKNTLTLNPRYDKTRVGYVGEDSIDGTWLLVAQHLVSWNHLFGLYAELPSVGLLMSRLAVLLKNR